MKLLALFLVLLWSGVAHAQKEPIGFKDFALGGSMSEFKARFPDFTCAGVECRFESRACLDALKPTECYQRNTYGGVVTSSVSASFKDDKLTRVFVRFSNVRYDSLRSALISRFGEPNTRAHEVMQNRMGAKFDNEVLTWTPADTILRISKYSLDIEKGSVFITTAEQFAEWQRQQKQAVEKGAKDL